MEILFELSKEHPSLPREETLSLLHATGALVKDVTQIENLLLVECERFDARRFSSRSAMCKSVQKVLFKSEPNENEIISKLSGLEFGEGSFSVRVSQSKELIKDAAVKVGRIIKQRGLEVNLSNPDHPFRLLITEGLALFCEEIRRIGKKHFLERLPKNRPFFHPGVMLPKMARALVNLTQVREGEIFMDPFCGTGSLLIEAGLMGAVAVGSDIDGRMVKGSLKNMRFYGIDGHLLIQDSTKLGIKDESVQAIATDPPYGRSTKVGGESLDILYEGALEEMLRVLERGRRCVVVFSHPREIDGWDVIGWHSCRVHKSLTRHIAVLHKQ